MITFYIIAAVLAVFGILIHKFKFYFLIAGYNMMSKEEKEHMHKNGKLVWTISAPLTLQIFTTILLM